MRAPPIIAGLAALMLAACTPIRDMLPPWAMVAPGPAGASGAHAEESLLALGARLLEEGHPAHAGRAFTRSLGIEGASAAAFTGAGIAAYRQGLLSEAIRHFEHARAIDPHYAAAHNNLGVVLYSLGCFRAAGQAFQMAAGLAEGSRGQIKQNLSVTEMALAGIDAADGSAESGGPALLAHEGSAGAGARISEIQRVGVAEYRLVLQPDAESG